MLLMFAIVLGVAVVVAWTLLAIGRLRRRRAWDRSRRRGPLAPSGLGAPLAIEDPLLAAIGGIEPRRHQPARWRHAADRTDDAVAPGGGPRSRRGSTRNRDPKEQRARPLPGPIRIPEGSITGAAPLLPSVEQSASPPP